MTTAARTRPATDRDIDSVLAIAEACAEAPHWPREHYANILSQNSGTLQRRTLIVSELHGQIAGFIVASALADQAEIESVAVLPSARRQGIGLNLSQTAMQWAKANGAEKMLLEVRSRNVTAQTMYARLGFTQVGLRRGYYSDPNDDAVLMASNL